MKGHQERVYDLEERRSKCHSRILLVTCRPASSPAKLS